MKTKTQGALTREERQNIIDFLRSFDVMMQTDWCERTLEMYRKMQAAADDMERAFGFTREDVELLQKWARGPQGRERRVLIRPTRNLISRIEALLPPEEET